MGNIPTPHNTAKPGDIAKKVLMPGDPLRAQFIAENYLENARCVNSIRGMLAYTGTYKGKEVTIMGSGMGIPSIGIYSYELYNFYDVDEIIRIGSAGALQDDVNVMDIVLAQGACTDSNYGLQYNLPGNFACISSYDLLSRAVEVAKEQGTPVHVGNVVSHDAFYCDDPTVPESWRKMGVLCAEMECAGLFMNAARAGKKALGILTISDHMFRDEAISAEDRQTTFRKMMELALEI